MQGEKRMIHAKGGARGSWFLGYDDADSYLRKKAETASKGRATLYFDTRGILSRPRSSRHREISTGRFISGKTFLEMCGE